MKARSELLDKIIWMCPPISQINEFITHFEKIRTKQPDRTSDVIVLPKLKNPLAQTIYTNK